MVKTTIQISLRHERTLDPYARRICALMMIGMRDEEIAAEIGKHKDAVRSYIGRTMRSAGVKTRPHLIAWYLGAVTNSARE